MWHMGLVYLMLQLLLMLLLVLIFASQWLIKHLYFTVSDGYHTRKLFTVTVACQAFFCVCVSGSSPPPRVVQYSLY